MYIDEKTPFEDTMSQYSWSGAQKNLIRNFFFIGAIKIFEITEITVYIGDNNDDVTENTIMLVGNGGSYVRHTVH